jgi:short-subunit dehydrogenase
VKGLLFTVQKALPLMPDGASTFARTWTTDLKNRRIRVNAVSPGATDTPGLNNLVASTGAGEQRLKTFSTVIPLGRLGRPDEIAKAVVFLASRRQQLHHGHGIVRGRRLRASVGRQGRGETDMDQNNGIALITGASTGIGAIYADRLARRGCDLVLVARDHGRMEDLAARLVRDTGARVEVLRADLTSKSDLVRVERRLREDDRITMLVNNAGTAASGSFVGADLDLLEKVILLNVVAVMRLAGAATPGFVARGRGTVINIGSVTALTPETFNGTYSATKAFVLNFTQALHAEVGDRGVRVQAVLPGGTRTEIWERSGFDLSRLPPERFMGVEEMVDAALAGLDQGELITIPSLPDAAEWDAFTEARRALWPNLSRDHAADRYQAVEERGEQARLHELGDRHDRRQGPPDRPGCAGLISGRGLIPTHQEGAQCRVGLVGRFFGEEVPAVEWMSLHVVGPASPDPQRVVPLLERALSAPERQDRAADASPLALVGFVLLEVERSRRSILFTDRVDRLGIVERTPVFGAHLVGKGAFDHAPAVQDSFEDRLGRGSHETLRQGVWL